MQPINMDHPPLMRLSFGDIVMTIYSNYEIPSFTELNFSSDESSTEFDNNIAEFELNLNPTEVKNLKAK